MICLPAMRRRPWFSPQKCQFKGASMRKESRGWFLREDYPQMDNENWLKWIVCENKDGEMEFSTEDVPIETYQVQPPRF